MRRTIIIRDKDVDTGYGRIEVFVDINGLQSSVGTNDVSVAGEIVKKTLDRLYDRCMDEQEGPRLEGEGRAA